MPANIHMHKSYEQRQPEASLMHKILREHLSTFVEEMQNEGRSLPKYITKSFENYLKCGIPAHGVTRMTCADCGSIFALPFSCKTRGICPSCHARRAAELAATMVDELIPHNPVRQFVVNFPYPLRLWMASNRNHLAKVCAIVCSIIQEFILTRASHKPEQARDPNIKTGLLCFVQRFGSSLNLNPHFPIIAMDGAFFCDEGYRPIFMQMPKLTDDNIALLTRNISETVNSYLIEEGLLTLEDGVVTLTNTEDIFEPDVDTEVHAPAMASSISQTIAFGPRRGQPVQRLRPAVGNCESWSNRFQSEITSPLCARYDGYTVHANRWIPQSDRKGLEKLISYAARGPLSEERLRDLPNGNVEVKLKTPWTNGTTHLIFTHSEFIEKLIALIPPSWFHMVRYFGMFVSNAKFRETILPGFDGKKKMPKQPKKKRSIKWADLLKRVFDIDVTKCQKCGGLLKLIDILMPSPELTQLLRQLHLDPDPPPRLPAKTSHLFDAFFEDEVFCE